MVQTYLVITSFLIIGGGLKYIDEAFDEDIFNKKIATILAGILILLWIGISYLDSLAGTILLGVLAGVLLTGKIDNIIFTISTGAIFASIAFTVKVIMPPFLFLALSGMIDEKGNDYVDNNNTNKVVSFFFLHRFTMKVALVLLTIIGVFSLTYLLAFILFDLAYDGIGYVGSQNMKVPIKSKKVLPLAA